MTSDSECIFNFEKTGALISPPPGMPGPGAYYPSAVDMRRVSEFPFDYALYFSTDHQSEGTGIWLYLCNGAPSEPGNWVSYDDARAAGAFDAFPDAPSANPVFNDTAPGCGHTETPHVNLVDERYLLTYHVAGRFPGQATLLAESGDGLSFRRVENGDENGIVLPYQDDFPGRNGHTGYMRWSRNPFAGIPHRFIGYSLYVGGDEYCSALWGSDDGREWTRLALLQPIEGLAVERDDRMVIWHEMDPGSIRRVNSEEYVALCCVGARASGSAARIVELHEVHLADDGKTLTRQSRKVLERGAVGEDDCEEMSSPVLIDDGADLHLLYVGARDGGGVNTVMGARGAFNADAPLPERIA